MANIKVTLIALGSCRVEHSSSGAVITTDLPPEYGGSGAGFSATDLLAAALGTCIATSIDKVAINNGIPTNAIKIEVTKELRTDPKRVGKLAVLIRIAQPFDELVRKKLMRAAETCPVHRSLNSDVVVEIVIEEVLETGAFT